MLKIKDTIDLKFLEQFGFEYDSDTERYYKDLLRWLTNDYLFKL